MTCNHAPDAPALRVTFDYGDAHALAHVDPDELAKSLTKQMRALGVGSHVVGQEPEGELSPYPAIRERLEAVRAAAEEQGRKLQCDVGRYLAKFEATEL